MKDNHKFCFIMCTNNKQYEEECIHYIQQLKIPQNYQVELLTVHAADSMTGGYNEAMTSSDAKYKIYLHQDVFIIHHDFLYDILRIFQDETIGMIGMVGCPVLPKCGVQWYGRRSGTIYACNILKTGETDFDAPKKPYEEVDAIDGLMMITQYDLPWREDLFHGFDFYDTSQSREFIQAGYKVVVPDMEKPWCIHDDGVIELENYYRDRRIYMEHYHDL